MVKKYLVVQNNQFIDAQAYDIRDRLMEMVYPNKDDYEGNSKFLRKSVEKLNGKVQTPTPYSDDVRHFESLIVNADKSFEIFLSPFATPLRDNFTIAHELGHLFFHSLFVAKEDKEGKKQVMFTRAGSNIYEWQANRFAVSFLMPEEEFKKIVKDTDANIYALSFHFQVSVKAVSIRKDTLDMT